MKTAVIGGGVIGLSLAWELANRGHTVTLIERDRFGRRASWAGAGILLPENMETATHEIERLAALSNDLHRSWSQSLLKQTQIDNGYRECGGLYLATSRGEIATLAGSIGYWKERSIEVESIDIDDIGNRFPSVETELPALEHVSAAWLPGEAQICNPWHLRALINACSLSGVRLIESCRALQIERQADRVTSIVANGDSFGIDSICFACGAWTEQTLAENESLTELNLSLPMTPVRGQMVLFKLKSQLDLPIINSGIRYIVPRPDGHVVVGATVEEVGFNTDTTDAELDELAAFAQMLVPALTREKIVKTWAGLRPGTFDGFPYMGALPGLANGFVATGHFKTGLQLSSGTAVVMANHLEGKMTEIDLAPFAPSRVLSSR